MQCSHRTEFFFLQGMWNHVHRSKNTKFQRYRLHVRVTSIINIVFHMLCLKQQNVSLSSCILFKSAWNTCVKQIQCTQQERPLFEYHMYLQINYFNFPFFSVPKQIMHLKRQTSFCFKSKKCGTLVGNFILIAIIILNVFI